MIPRLRAPDSTLGLRREGYPYISRRCDRLGTDAFRTRLLGSPTVCARGEDAARMFYGSAPLTRQGAMPSTVLHLLQDVGSVEVLDGAAHRHRKQMFLQMLPQQEFADVRSVLADEWAAGVRRWAAAGRVVLHDELHEVFARTAARWAGVPLAEEEAPARTRELSAMIAEAGSIGPAHWRARLLRRRCEAWAGGLVESVRAGELTPPAGSALATIASYDDLDGRPLATEVAVVELLDVLRPTVAVARFVVFAALALLQQPQWRERFAAGDEADLRPFAHEVRRFFPFFPLIAGLATEPFAWHGHDFAEGERFVLDLYGTNHDARLWPEPEVFRPERFRGWAGDPFTLVPQGGGDPLTDHRCPGEPMTVALLEEAVRLLTRTMSYDVPVQDLSVRLDRIPAAPADGLVIDRVRPR